MPISYPLTFPTINEPASITMRQQTIVAETISPFTGSRKVQKHQGQWWEAEVTMPPMLNESSAIWEAFLTKLNGIEGTFTMGDASRTVPRGSAGTSPGTPLVNGGSQLGNDLIMDGAPNGATGYLLAGDWIQLGTGGTARLYKILDDVDIDGSGNGTFTIWPEIISANQPSNDQAITVSGAKSLWNMVDNVLEWNSSPFLYGIAFGCKSVV